MEKKPIQRPTKKSRDSRTRFSLVTGSKRVVKCLVANRFIQLLSGNTSAKALQTELTTHLSPNRMVNYGVSRGCDTCKERRKKCDETRPACNRCVKSRRPCPGYKNSSALLFRYHQPTNTPLAPTLERWSPNADTMLETTALDVFLGSLVVQSQDRQQSRGFLDGMHSLFATFAPTSTLLSAAKIVILASLANRYRRVSLLRISQRQYGQLLVDYAATLSRTARSLSIEQFFTAILLGLYEMVVSNDASPTKYLVHVRGLASILGRGIMHIPPAVGARVYAPGTHLVTKGAVTHQQGAGVLCPPLDGTYRRSLDQIIIKMSPLTSRAEQLLTHPSPPRQALVELQQELLALYDEIVCWADDRPPSWIPTLVGHVWRDAHGTGGHSYCCPGPVEEYFDVYVAAAWNSWRSVHVIYLDLLIRVAKGLGQEQHIPSYMQRVGSLAAGIKASIPYHLSRNVEEYIQQANSGLALEHSDHLVRGLLLLHPLYAAARCTVMDTSNREYITCTLRWIGTKMGINQANILAHDLESGKQGSSAMQDSGVSFIDILDGHFLITASMMLEPRRTPII